VKTIATLRAGEVQRVDVVSHPDSVAKILKQISRLSPDVIEYLPDRSRPGSVERFASDVQSVSVMPSMFKRFVCVSGCTACCQKFTLDYPPSEFFQVEHKEGFIQHLIEINGKVKTMWTNNQNENPLCDFLRVEKPGGGLGCAHWPHAPLSCASAPQLQIKMPTPGDTIITKQAFDDLETWTPVPQCRFEDASLDQVGIEADVDLLARFAEWARYFGIKTCIGHIQEFLMHCLHTGLVPTTPYTVWSRA
jgi:hypothetical protein